jgi:hypothetical protein
MNVLTLGLLEIVGTPIEGVQMSRTTPLSSTIRTTGSSI